MTKVLKGKKGDKVGYVMTEARVRVRETDMKTQYFWFEDGRGGHKIRNTGGP